MQQHAVTGGTDYQVADAHGVCDNVPHEMGLLNLDHGKSKAQEDDGLD
jgi:hypothetical protein